jgi:low temperature requirement protein LtrA
VTSTAIPWRRPLGGRDREEENRVSTPLELLFDLCFVVAVSAAAAGLHHSLAGGHIGLGLGNYAMVFFAIWWAWVNYSWFASAYDTGDVRFRLTTFVIMGGVLVMAAAIPAVKGAEPDYRLLVVGYLIMRIALVPMWLQVARDHPAARTAALRYAVSITVVQALWVSRLGYQHGRAGTVSFIAFALMEVSVPYFAEVRTGQLTPWHPEHIAERYELFTIIVLGEVILATTQAISASLDRQDVTGNLVMVVAGGLLLVLGLWWLYFKSPMVEALDSGSSFFFGYAHFVVFGSIAAVGAALATSVDVVEKSPEISQLSVVLLLAGAVTCYLLALGAIHTGASRSIRTLTGPVATSAAVLVAALVGHAASNDIGLPVLLVGIAVTGAVLHHQVSGQLSDRDRT